MGKALKILRKIIFWIFFACLFITTVMTVVLYVYEDDIKQYAVDELNAYLDTRIEVRNIELSMFHNFPSASLEFENVFIADAYESKYSEDTLLFAEKVFFNFSLTDILNEDYKVKRISALNGQLNLKTASDGDFNYGVLRKEKDSLSEGNNFEFLLELLKLRNIDLRYMNQSTKQNYEIDIREALLKGDFTAKNYQLLAEGNVFIHELRSGSFSLIKEKAAHFDLDMNVNKPSKSYTFNKGDLTVEEMPFKITGMLDSAFIDLEIKGHNVELEQLANSLVDESLEEAKEYEGVGVIDFQSQIKGEISKTTMPSVSAEFSLMKGSLKEPESKLQINNINLVGHYYNKQENREEELKFENLSFRLLQSHFLGSAVMQNFEQPILETKMRGDLDLSAFDRFFGFKKVQKVGGHIKMNLDAAVRFFDPEYRKDRFDIIKADGFVTLVDVLFKSEDTDLEYERINGDLIIHGKDAAAKNLGIKTKRSDFVLNGAIKNLVPYIEGSGGLGLIASLESENFDLNEFIGLRKKTNPEKQPEQSKTLKVFELPSDLNLNLELHVNNLDWENHHFENISGQLLYANRKGTLNKFRLNTLGGNVRGDVSVTNALYDGNIVEGNVRFKKVDIKALFAEWKNFNQKSITEKNISGRASGDINFLLGFNPYFSIIEDKIYVKADVEVNKGELKQLEMMKEITAYMRSNKALKVLLNKHIDKFEEKLLSLRFSDLKNIIEIKDRKIVIPRMTISTNALDLHVFGWHDFDNNVDYHFSFKFRDLKTVAEYTDFGKIEDDGLGLTIYLSMTGNIEDPQFALDKEERKNQLKVNLTQEKEDVKSILKTELGLFKNDSTVKKMEESNKREVEFIFYEDDIEEKEDTLKKGKNKKRSSNFFDRLKKKSKKEEEIEFEVE